MLTIGQPRDVVRVAEVGIGRVSELFDGDAPHTPRGCTAQAWSVAEVSRATT
jgi:glycogen debranching enzyme